jgi:serine/threonine protein kinase
MPPHSNIVTVFDILENKNQEKYFVCENVDSGTLSGHVYEMIHSFNYDLQERVPRRYIKLLYEFIIQMCNAMEFAHKNNLIHGDFKLRNVVVKKFNRKKVLFKVKGFRNT